MLVVQVLRKVPVQLRRHFEGKVFETLTGRKNRLYVAVVRLEQEQT